MVSMTVSHPRINIISTSDFNQKSSPWIAAFSGCNGPVASIVDQETRTLVVAKEGTDANTAVTPDTETKAEGMKIDNKLSNLKLMNHDIGNMG